MTRRTFASIAAVIMLVLSAIGVPFIAHETATPTAQAQTTGPAFGANEQCVENPQGPKPLKGIAFLLDISFTNNALYHMFDTGLDDMRDQMRVMAEAYSEQGGDFAAIYVYDSTSPSAHVERNPNWETSPTDIRGANFVFNNPKSAWNQFDNYLRENFPLGDRKNPSAHHNWAAAMKRVADDQANGWMYTDVINMPFAAMTEGTRGIPNPTRGEPAYREIDFRDYMEWKNVVEKNGATIQTVGLGDTFVVNYSITWKDPQGDKTVRKPDLPTKHIDLMKVTSSEGTNTTARPLTSMTRGLTNVSHRDSPIDNSGYRYIRSGGFPGIANQQKSTCLTISVGKDDGDGNVTLDTTERTFHLDTSVRTGFSEDTDKGLDVATERGFANTQLPRIEQKISTALPGVPDDYKSTTMPVCYASLDGKTWEELEVGKDSTPTKLDVDLPAAAKVNCQFTVRKTTSVTLAKNVVADSNIQNELDSDRYGQYHFAYTCEDKPTGFSVSGLFSPVRRNKTGSDNKPLPPLEGDMQLPAEIPADPNNPSAGPARIPVGATCTITELQPRTSEGYFSHTTSWDSDNAIAITAGSTSSFPYPTVKEREPIGVCGLVRCDRKWIERDTSVEKNNPTATFVVKPQQGADGVTVTSTNTYKSPKTLFKASLSVTTPDVLGRDMPEYVDVTFSCRYIPSADKRPEIASNPEQYPVVVGSGSQKVPVSKDGKAEAVLGEFPVGTQCEVNTIAPDKKKESPLIPGYSYKATWSSRSCMKQIPDDPGYTDTPQTCKGNYVYAYSKSDSGEPVETETVDGVPMDVHKVHGDLTFTRITRKLDITKHLAGKAQSDAQAKEFNATLTCTDTKYPDVATVQDQKLTLNPNTTQHIDVPVRSSCTVTEDNPNTEDSLLQITPPAPATVNVDVGSTANIPVDITNTVEDKYAEFSWTYTPNTAGGSDPLPAETQAQLQGLPMDFKTVCVLPDNDRFEVVNEAIPPGGTFSIGIPDTAKVSERWEKNGKLPYGTRCHTTYVPPNFKDAGIEAQARPSGSETKLGKEIPITGDERNDAVVSFERITSSVRVNVSHVRPNVPDVSQYMPQKYYVDMDCFRAGTGVFDSYRNPVTADQQWTEFTGVPEGATCKVKIYDAEGTTWQDVFTRTTTITTGPPASLRVSVPPAEGDSTEVSATASADGHAVTFEGELQVSDGAATLEVVHTYIPINQTLTVNKQLTVTGADDKPVTDKKLLHAFFGDDETWNITASCTRNGQTIERGAQVSPTAPAVFHVPVGADCSVTEHEQTYTGLDGPTIAYNGVADATPYKVTRGQDLTIDVSNTYAVQLGQINLKKKVDGTGVQTVNGGRRFKVDYTCRLGEWEKSGLFETTRFDQAPNFSVKDVPVGAACTFTEDPKSSRNPEDISGLNKTGDPTKENDAYFSHWETRWNVTEDELGFDTEQLCSGLANCTVTSKEKHEAQATFIVNDKNFKGTLVLWNTYDYTKVPLVLEKKVAGDGQRLLDGGKLEPITVDYSCTHPDWATSNLKEKTFIPDPTINGSVTFDQTVGVVPAGKDIPGNFVCTVTEHPVKTFGGTVTVGYSGTDNPVTTSTTEDSAGMVNNRGVFQIDRKLAESSKKEVRDDGTHEWVSTGEQKLTLTNDYQRPRAPLTANFGYEKGMPGDVSPWITAPEGGISVTGSCEDPDVPGVSDPINGILKPGEDVLLNDNVIAGSQCTLTTTAKDKAPNSVINVTETYTQSAGDPLKLIGTLQEPGKLQLRNGPNKLDIRASYVVPQVSVSLTKEVVGDDEKKIIGDADPIPFDYTCTFANLIGEQPAPFDPEGSFDLTRGGTWSQTVPTGSSCTVTEKQPAPAVAKKLTDKGAQMSPYTVQGEDKIATSTATLDKDHPQLTLVNAIYRADAEVQVQKVQADLTTALEGSQFAIYEATQDGMAATPVATMASVAGEAGKPGPAGRFTARLKPGTYYLVETHAPAGAALLPGAWKFTVNAVNDPKREFADLQIELAARTENSGLVTITEAKPEAGKPAMIQVANILQGKLPLTGSYGVFWWILGGLVLIGAGLVWRRRSNEKH